MPVYLLLIHSSIFHTIYEKFLTWYKKEYEKRGGGERITKKGSQGITKQHLLSTTTKKIKIIKRNLSSLSLFY